MALYLTVALVAIAVLLLIGTPVAFALGSVASIMVLLFASPVHLGQFTQIAYSYGTSSNMLIAPLFVLMAEFLSQGRIAEDLFSAMSRKFGKLRSGLGIVTTLVTTLFASMCASSSATAAAIGRITIAEMIKSRYDPAFTVGIVMSGATLGIMIPPSIVLVFFGIITETSIAKLLMAGLLPGLMIAALLCIFILIRVKLNPKLVDTDVDLEVLARIQKLSGTLDKKAQPVFDGKKRLSDSAVLKIFAPMILVILVLGSLYTGLALPNECAGVGAIGALIIVILLRRFDMKMFENSLTAAARTSVMIIFLTICGFGLTYIISYLGIASQIANAIISSGANKWLVIILVYILWLILGSFMDPGSMVILTVPFLLSSLNSLGFDTIWIGVVSTLLVEVGMITPPTGLNLFVTKSITDLSFGLLVRGALPFLLVFLVALILLTIFPQIALFLPSIM